MDYVGVEIGEAPVRVGDEALLFGSAAPGAAAVLPVEEAAAAADTLAYELMVRVGSRVSRVFVGGSRAV
jgi:alanine racemase